jgi:hypothetical protein
LWEVDIKFFFFFNRFSVLRTSSLSPEQSLSLHELDSREEFQFWKSPRTGAGADIMASPDKISDLKKILKELNIDFETMVEDVEK